MKAFETYGATSFGRLPKDSHKGRWDLRIRLMAMSMLAGGGVLLAAPQVLAQDTAGQAADNQIAEVVVTAQHRSENLQTVPIAVSVADNQALQQRGLTNVAQVSSFMPNVTIANTASFAGSSQVLVASIRGIGQNDFAFNLEPGVGIYIDGVYFARSIGAVVDLLDLDRIEVLKGPQGTLFGRNTIGGALNITTREPAREFAAQTEVTMGSFHRADVRGSVDLPLIDDVLLSQVSFSHKERDGFQKRIPFPGAGPTDRAAFIAAGPGGGSDRQGGENATNLRAKLKWTPTDRLSVLLSADYTHVDQEARPSTLLAVRAGAADGTLAAAYNGCIFGAAPSFICSTRATVGTSFYGVNVDADPNNNRTPFSNAFITGDRDTTYARGSNFDKLTASGYSLNADWKLSENASIKSITAFRRLHSSFGSEIAATPIVANDASFDTKQHQFSQELQYSSTTFDGRMKNLVGLYYFDEAGGLRDTVIFAEGLVQIDGPNAFKNKSYAAFAHEHFDITDRWGVTFGARYTDEKKRFEGKQGDLNSFFLRGLGYDPNLPLPPSAIALLPDPNDKTRLYPLGVNHLSFHNTSFRFGTEYKLTDEVMAYYSFSQGFKSGGWTTRLVNLNPGNSVDDLTFQPEKADTHEVGVKATLFQRRLRLNVAAFDTDYSNIQVTQFNGTSPVFKNGGQATIRGFEAEGQARLGDLSITASVGYLDAFYKTLAPGVTFPKDNDLVNAPKWSTSLSGLYTIALGDGAQVRLAADYSYKSDASPDAENSPYLRSGDVGLANASVSYWSADTHWSLTAGVSNLTDKRYIVGGYDQTPAGAVGFSSAAYNPPRQWYLTLRVKM